MVPLRPALKGPGAQPLTSILADNTSRASQPAAGGSECAPVLRQEETHVEVQAGFPQTVPMFLFPWLILHCTLPHNKPDLHDKSVSPPSKSVKMGVVLRNP